MADGHTVCNMQCDLLVGSHFLNLWNYQLNCPYLFNTAVLNTTTLSDISNLSIHIVGLYALCIGLVYTLFACCYIPLLSRDSNSVSCSNKLLLLLLRYINKARGVKAKAKTSKPRPRLRQRQRILTEIAKGKLYNVRNFPDACRHFSQ